MTNDKKQYNFDELVKNTKLVLSMIAKILLHRAMNCAPGFFSSNNTNKNVKNLNAVVSAESQLKTLVTSRQQNGPAPSLTPQPVDTHNDQHDDI